MLNALKPSREDSTTAMIAPLPNARALLLESPNLGVNEINQMRRVAASDQYGELRQAYLELTAQIETGKSEERNLLAAGLAAYVLGRASESEQLLKQTPKSGVACFYRGKALQSLERYEESAEAFEKAAANGFDAPLSHLCRAGAIRLAGRLDDAETLLKQKAREGVNRAEYSYQMGCILSDRGDTFGALEYFERAVDMDPHHSEALFRLAGENNLLGNDQEAIRLYERSLSKPPYPLGALMNLGLLYEDSENYRAAAFCFRRVLAAQPNHARALLYLKDIEAAADMYYDEDAERRGREMTQVMNVPITDFELSARSRNCLERAGIATLGDLTRVTENDLLAGKNFGETSLKEIRDLMTIRGLRIGQALAQSTPAVAAVKVDDLPPQERALMQKMVSDLNLSVRSRKCLSRLGITSLAELLTRSGDELMSVRNFGVTSLNEIRAKLGEIGLKLRND